MFPFKGLSYALVIQILLSHEPVAFICEIAIQELALLLCEGLYLRDKVSANARRVVDEAIPFDLCEEIPEKAKAVFFIPPPVKKLVAPSLTLTYPFRALFMAPKRRLYKFSGR